MVRRPAKSRDRMPTGIGQARPRASKGPRFLGFAQRDEGFTLIEVMAAMLLFLMVSTSTVTLLIQGMKAVRENTDRSVAANIARTEIEFLRDLGRLDPSIIPAGQFEGPLPPNIPAQYSNQVSATYLDPVLFDSRYAIKTTSNWVDYASTAAGNTSPSPCDATTTKAVYLRVVVTVESPDMAEPVSLQTNITQLLRPATTTTTTVGAAAISVVNDALVPVSDVRVTFSDAFHTENSLSALVTGFDGCLFLPKLTPSASLVVTISRSGYVPSTPTGTVKTLSISPDLVTKVTFEYAPAATLKFTGSEADFPLPADTAVRWKTSGTGGSVQSNVITDTVTGLWPGDSIDGWAGGCPDADPQNLASTRPNYTLYGGQTTVAALAVAPVKLTGLMPNQAVTAKHTAGNCTVDEAIGTADENGVLRVGLPYGDWSFKATTLTPATAETLTLPNPLLPPAPGDAPTVVTLPFTLQVDIKPTISPSPTGTPSPSPSPTGTDFPSLSPTPTTTPSPTDTSSPGLPMGP